MCKWEYDCVFFIKAVDLHEEINSRAKEDWEPSHVIPNVNHDVVTFTVVFRRCAEPEKCCTDRCCDDERCCERDTDCSDDDSELDVMEEHEMLGERCHLAIKLKGANLMSDRDILEKVFEYKPDEADGILARLKVQKLEELKLAMMAQNRHGHNFSAEPTVLKTCCQTN